MNKRVISDKEIRYENRKKPRTILRPSDWVSGKKHNSSLEIKLPGKKMQGFISGFLDFEIKVRQ